MAGEALEFLADELPEAATECDAAHGVDAEVSVVEEHEELLHAPQRSRCLLAPQREAHEHKSTLRLNDDNETGLRKMLESVLDSDCEYIELSDDEIETGECVSSSDSSSSASSGDESDNKNDVAPGPFINALVLRHKTDSDWNWTESYSVVGLDAADIAFSLEIFRGDI
ncbi:hypothetical protein C0J52_18918 [Blattella germanica]|nr:hypothetical protein C0J52_18918 [Blattella germanica]